MTVLRRLSIRLFLSYLAIVVISAGVVFATARLIAPTFFQENLENIDSRTTTTLAPTGSTVGPGASTSTLTPGSGGPPGTTTPAGPGSTQPPGTPPGPGPTSGSSATTGPGTTQGPGSSQPGPGATTRSGTTTTATTNRSGTTTGSGTTLQGPTTSLPPSSTGTTNTTTHAHGRDAAPTASTAGVLSVLAASPNTAELVPDDEVNEAFRSALETALLVAFAIGILVAALLALIVSRRIMLPIELVRDTTIRLARGQYDERVPVPAEQELAALARDVNTLAATLENTEQRRARLISDVTHELRTPLTTIEGYMEGLIDGVLEPGEQVFSVVADEAARLKRVVADLGLLSRIDEGVLTLERGPVDPYLIATTVAERLQPQFSDQQVELVTDGEDGLLIGGDEDRLAQIFTNLIGNALTHTPPGGRVSVIGKRVDGWVSIEVTDTGSGVAPEALERIFDRFYRAPGTDRRGSGIGLTIARSLARAHGGEVEASSGGPGRGATLTVRLPSA
ncbi:MAG: HAMP domain-containing protein [Acidimicrobiia bacterium]|nr:HAMP domain-containing protein [Acidimicrobiia bacterium]